MKKLLLIFLLLTACCVYASDINYKYTSSIPIEVVKLSKVDVNDIERFLNSSALTIFCLDSDNIDKDVLSYLYIKRYNSSENGTTENLYNVTNGSYKKLADDIYEIKKNKLLFLHPASLNDIKTLDFIGEYIAKNGGVFAYINKVPPNYKHILASAVAVNKVIPDKDGDYAIDVAGRKIRVNVLEDRVINRKLKGIAALKALGINVTYIVTGDEGIDIVKKSKVNKDELKELLNDYWFKAKDGNYTHLYFNPEKLTSELKDIEVKDILALSYYPTIYFDKSPYTFENDPIGGYYPTVITYKGTSDYGYWEVGVKSRNYLYHLVQGEPYWKGVAEEPSKWYYGGVPLLPTKEDEIENNRYKYFNYWFIKDYAYALREGCDGLFLESSDKNLTKMILGDTTEDWKLTAKDKIKYLVIPGKKGFELYDDIPIIKIPTPLKEIYGMNVVNTLYIPPKDEEFGVYVSDIRRFNSYMLLRLKENDTAVMSFKELAEWLKKYYKNNIFYNGTTIRLYDNDGVKITIFKKDFNIDNYTVEEFDEGQCKYVIVNPPKVIPLQ
jgi:hypothetical protein